MAGSASFVWLGAGLIGLVTVAPQIDRAASPDETEAADGGYTIPRAPDGQFYAEARVGAVPIRFMVDGSSPDVVLTADDAARAGVATTGPATLPSLAIGPKVVSNVTVEISSDIPVSLVGRGFLSRNADAEIRRDRLILR